MLNAIRNLEDIFLNQLQTRKQWEHDDDQYREKLAELSGAVELLLQEAKKSFLGTFLWIADQDGRKPRPVCLDTMGPVTGINIYKNQMSLLGKKGQLFFSEGT